MAIGKLPGAGALAGLLRASLTARAPSREAHETQRPAHGTSPEIRQRLAAIVGRAAPTSPEDWKQLRPVLLQAILVDALGEAIARHPEFPTFLREIDDALDAQPGLWEGAIRELSTQRRNTP